MFDISICYLTKAILFFFQTGGGGGIGHIVRDVKKLGTDAIVRDCLDVYEGSVADAKAKLTSWLHKNGLAEK